MSPPTDVQEAPEVESGRARARMDPRFRARRIEVRRDEGRRRLRRLGLVGVGVGVVLALLLLVVSPLLDVDRIEVDGTFRTSPAQVVEVAGIDRGDPTLLVDRGAAAARVARLPWVRDVQVERSLPGTVRIVVEEREPRAVVQTAAGAAVIVDGDGQVVQPVEGDPAVVELPVLDGVLGPGQVGERLDVDDELVAALLRVAGELPGGLAPVVAAVRAGEAGVQLDLRPVGRVVLGDGEQLEEAFVALASVLGAVAPTCVDTVDVSVPAAPVLTRVPGCQ